MVVTVIEYVFLSFIFVCGDCAGGNDGDDGKKDLHAFIRRCHWVRHGSSRFLAEIYLSLSSFKWKKKKKKRKETRNIRSNAEARNPFFFLLPFSQIYKPFYFSYWRHFTALKHILSNFKIFSDILSPSTFSCFAQNPNVSFFFYICVIYYFYCSFIYNSWDK